MRCSFLLSFFIVNFLSGVCSLSAQQLRFGVHAGSTTADFYDNNHPLSKNFWGIPTLGATFGTVEQLTVGNWGQLQLEQNISWEGSKGHFWNEKNLKLWYLTTPLLMKFKIHPNFWVAGGLEANYLLDITGSSEIYKGNHWNGAAIFQVEHLFLDRFACSIRYFHGFTRTSIINYDGQNSNLSTYSGRRLHISISYFFCELKMQPKWVEGQTYFY